MQWEGAPLRVSEQHYLLGCYKSNILDTENGCTQIVVVALVPRNFGGPEFHGLEPLTENCLGNVS